MSEEDLQLLITLDDPVDLPEEDTFNHQYPLEQWRDCRAEVVL